jgi:hypothetical protein
VLDHPTPVPLRQIDLIVWAPFPAPALFDVEGFGLVPKSSAFGVIEVKRSNYSGVEVQLDGFLADVDAKKIVSDPAGPVADYQQSPGLGLVCVLESAPSARLQAFSMLEGSLRFSKRVTRSSASDPRTSWSWSTSFTLSLGVTASKGHNLATPKSIRTRLAADGGWCNHEPPRLKPDVRPLGFTQRRQLCEGGCLPPSC